MFINNKTIEVATAEIYADDGKLLALLVGTVPSDAKYLGEFSVYPVIYNGNNQYQSPDGISIFRNTDKDHNIVINDIMNDIIGDISVSFDSNNGVYTISFWDIAIYLDYRGDTKVDVMKSTLNGKQAWVSSVSYEFEDDDDLMTIRKIDINGTWYVDKPMCITSGLKIDIK